jgi:hypothetical protein
LRFPASAVGYLSFLLTLARSAWIGWLGGLLVLTGSLKAKYQIRLFAIVLAMTILVIPVVTLGPFSENISARIQTLSNVQEDGSFNARQSYLTMSFETYLSNAIGSGIGLGLADNAILSLLYSLGWIGVFGYVGGLILLILKLFQNLEERSNFFASTARAVVASCLIRIPVNGTSIVAVGGLILWSFLGLTVASQQYFLNKNIKEVLAIKELK